jgi:hypothetical protein
MNAIRNVFSALGTLANSINSLARVLDVATGRLRQQLVLDDAPPALPGEVIDAPADESTPSTRRRKGA